MTEAATHAQRASILLDLARSPNVGTGHLSEALREITEAASRALDVARASIWLYSPDRREIRCIDLYLAEGGTHTSGAVLLASDYPEYFEALTQNRTIPAHEAHNDPRTHEFSAGYLTPLGITSMLDAPLRVGGQMIGVVCHEHVGPPRTWSLDEQNFAGSIADYTALAMQANELRLAREAAQEASRGKSALLANLSHELRTPLNSIIGFSELLRDRADAATAPKLATIESAGRTLLAMIDELLEMASLEAGLTHLDQQAYDLESLIEALAGTARVAIEKHANQFEVTSPIPSMKLYGDSEKVWRMLWNLLDNANKFTHRGTVTLTVEKVGDSRVRFVVRDTGVGIAPEHLAIIFQPFVQADPSLRRRHGGAGLGLAITSRLCDLMGATLEAESELGRGSAFTVTIDSGLLAPRHAQK